MTARKFGLGRHVNHDPRSRDFPADAAATHNPVLHRHYGAVLDQGQVGSCTGNAAAQSQNTAPFHVKGEKLLTEKDALAIYSAATQIDDAPGSYPPDDTGSNGLSVAKVLQKLGYISKYTHAFDPGHAIGALQISPFLFGTNWYEDMFNPDSSGLIHVGGALAGGHEILCVGDDGKGKLKFLNSWGKSWGKGGYFYLTYDDFGKLMAEQGDVTVPVK